MNWGTNRTNRTNQPRLTWLTWTTPRKGPCLGSSASPSRGGSNGQLGNWVVVTDLIHL